ncbi:hypothetical protein ABZ942_41795 [Nocardia sp. NPDC046473]|uniref:hypothetical protein n=1 Tax=Nocardia sp. NPDC046473 TaxID=3155733 RepID=UPI0033C7C153
MNEQRVSSLRPGMTIPYPDFARRTLKQLMLFGGCEDIGAGACPPIGNRFIVARDITMTM